MAIIGNGELMQERFPKRFPVKNYRRGVADFFGVILLKRRRIACEVSTLWA